MLSYSQRRYILNFPPYLLGIIYAVISSYGVISGGIWGGIGISGSLLMVILVGFGRKVFPMPSKNAIIFLGLGLFIAFSSCFSAIDRAQSLHNALKMLTIFLPLIFFSSPILKEYNKWILSRFDLLAILFIASFLILTVFLAISYNLWGHFDRVTTHFNRGFSYGVLLAIPTFAILLNLKKKKLLSFVLFISCFLAILFTSSRSVQLGSFVALIMFFISKAYPIFAKWILRIGTIFFFVFPLCVFWIFGQFHEKMSMLPISWRHRMEIWDNLSYRIKDNILFGQGIGNTNKIEVSGDHSALYKIMEISASHPHNAAMQLWIETGVFGVFFGVFTCFWASRTIENLPVKYRPYANSAYIFGLILSMISYNLWTDSLWSAYAITAFTFSFLLKEKSEKLRDH